MTRVSRLAPAILSVAAIAAAQPAAAQETTSVAGFVAAYATAFNTCDADLFGSLLAPGDFSGFGAHGGLGVGQEAAVASFQAVCDAGYAYDMSLEVLDSGEVGDAAFAAVLGSGSVTPAGGQPLENTLRITLVLVRQGTDAPWLLRHSHISGL